MKTSHPLSTLGAVVLNRVFGNRPFITQEIIGTFGSIQDFFALPLEERSRFAFSLKLEADALDDSALLLADEELSRLESRACRFLSIESPDYPTLLRECPDAPAGLYIRSSSSDAEIFGREHAAVSIVGTRDISLYGKEWTRRIVFNIASAGKKATIVSGLALGVDAAAHRSALEAGIPTIAVLPCGIDEVYPACHTQLAQSIAQSPASALVSDFPPHSTPFKGSFIRRNRIIAGLSGSTILIESKRHGGGMITATTAAGYSRNVFALPGRIDDLRSAGCNNLIKEKIAEPIAELGSLNLRLGIGRSTYSPADNCMQLARRHYGSSPDLKDICTLLGMIAANRGISVEDLAEFCNMGYSRTLALINRLENDGFISCDLLQRCTIVIKNA